MKIDLNQIVIIICLVIALFGFFFTLNADAMHEKYENMMEECYDDYEAVMAEFDRVFARIAKLPEEEVLDMCIEITNQRLESEK